jgi:hypothetical protein
MENKSFLYGFLTGSATGILVYKGASLLYSYYRKRKSNNDVSTSTQP